MQSLPALHMLSMLRSRAELDLILNQPRCSFQQRTKLYVHCFKGTVGALVCLLPQPDMRTSVCCSIDQLMFLSGTTDDVMISKMCGPPLVQYARLWLASDWL